MSVVIAWLWNVSAQGSLEKGRSKTPLLLWWHNNTVLYLLYHYWIYSNPVTCRCVTYDFCCNSATRGVSIQYSAIQYTVVYSSAHTNYARLTSEVCISSRQCRFSACRRPDQMTMASFWLYVVWWRHYSVWPQHKVLPTFKRTFLKSQHSEQFSYFSVHEYLARCRHTQIMFESWNQTCWCSDGSQHNLVTFFMTHIYTQRPFYTSNRDYFTFQTNAVT